jgi:surface antigen
MSNGLPTSFRARRIVVMACIVSFSSVLIAACASSEMGDKAEQGEEIGSILGGIIGPLIPGSSIGAQILQQHGDLIGGIIGGAIGAALDEEDQKALAKSTNTAFETGKNQSFSNKKTGVRATAKVTGTRLNAKGQQCRTVRQDVTLKNGKSASDTVSACKGPDGWKKT